MPGIWRYPNHQPFLFKTTCCRDFQLGCEGPQPAEHLEVSLFSYKLSQRNRDSNRVSSCLRYQLPSSNWVFPSRLNGMRLPGAIKLSNPFLEPQQADKLIVRCWNQQVSKDFTINLPSVSRSLTALSAEATLAVFPVFKVSLCRWLSSPGNPHSFQRGQCKSKTRR